MAVPIVLLATIAAFALAGATVVASVTSQSGSTRDQDTKAALGAAESGVSNALLRFNRLPPESEGTICSPLGGTWTNAQGWCPVETSGEIDRGSYSYWVRPTLGENEIVLQIVSTGTVDGVSRRIEVEARSAQSLTHQTRPFSQHSVIGLDYVTQDSNSIVTGNMATNGDITLASNAQLICGTVQVGAGRKVLGSFSCPPANEGSVELPPVNQGDVTTNNSNYRITLAKQNAPGGDTISGNRNRVDWNPEARTLTLNSNTSLTLGGANYSLCSLRLNSNSSLFIVSGTTVRIYFDSPEACGLSNGDYQLYMESNASVQATGSEPGDLALLFVGSESITTRIRLASNTSAEGPCQQTFMLYAPRLEIELASNTHICGALAAKSVTFESNAKVTTSNTANQFELPNTESQYFSGYSPANFVECSARPVTLSTPPDAGC